MSDIGQSSESLSKELLDFCKSEALSEEGLRAIVDRHGLTLNHAQTTRKYNKVFRAACRNERVTEGIIRCLLEYFPAAASANNGGWTPLHCVCYNKNVRNGIVQLLIDAAPDSIRSVTNMGNMPLHILCSNQYVDEMTAIEISKLLIEKYPEAVRHADNDGGWLPIHIASQWRSSEFCRVLIEAYPGSKRISTNTGALPLHHACYKGSLATAEYLYHQYPDAIHHAAAGGDYPIHSAILGTKYRNNPATAVKIVQFLLDCDPDLKLKRLQGKSLLQYACMLPYNGSTIGAAIQVIKVLFDAHPEAIENNQISTLIRRYHQQVQAFINGELVYAHQAKKLYPMMTYDDNGYLPLHRALQNKVRLGSIKLLVKGNPHALQSPYSALPLHVACRHHDSANVVRYLIGLDTTSLGATDREGNTALHYACRGAKYQTIALLLEKYNAVSVSKRNAQNKLPIELLWESNEVSDRESLKHTEMVFRLLRAYPEIVTTSNLKV